MDKVFVFEKGEDYEGSHICGIYATEDSALRDLAIAFNRRFDRFSEYLPEEFAVELMPVWDKNGVSFQSGCDYWTVDVLEVEV